jgi:tRNA threonylcarbamoyladenosine biosynthesis protein TsaE
VCKNAAETEAAGEDFAALLRPGDVVLLSGALGAGKTTFVKGVARALGVAERVTSPTFTIVRPHPCHNDRGIDVLHHADVYRVSSIDEVFDLGLGELVEESGIAIIEWGELAAAAFGDDVIRVDFVDEGEGRRLSVHAERDGLARWAS